jgi:hypothetical protein
MHKGQQYTVKTAGAWTPYYKKLISTLRQPSTATAPHLWLEQAAEMAASHVEFGPGDFASKAMAALNTAGMVLGVPNPKDIIRRGWDAGLVGALPAPEGEEPGRELITFVVEEILYYASDRRNKAERWYEVELVRTDDGRLVLRRGWITRYQNESDSELFYVVSSPGDASQFLGGRTPDLSMIEWVQGR